jgi:hypothetical protein
MLSTVSHHSKEISDPLDNCNDLLLNPMNPQNNKSGQTLSNNLLPAGLVLVTQAILNRRISLRLLKFNNPSRHQHTSTHT